MRMLVVVLLACLTCSSAHAILVRQTVRRADGTTYQRTVAKPDGYVIGSSVAKDQDDQVHSDSESEEIDGYYQVARDPEAYKWALREATILAKKGSIWYNSAVVRSASYGHPLGSSPGATQSGTGYSRSPKEPRHCCLNELPHSRLIARARVQADDGTWFWSAHYR
ncbi:MAG: hypothetical protein KDB27_12595 [Planctomycetales bacterium]|nr:hypothetical protein [Planctomycetales bacterium]